MLVALSATLTTGFSQLTTRENAESVYQLGTRPQEGDLSLMFGLPLTSNDKFVPINLLKSGDLLTGKYYLSNSLVLRGGLRLVKTDSTNKGEGNADFDPSLGGLQTIENFKSNSRDFDLRVGLEHHFSNSNLFDVYTGADLHLGFSKTLTKTYDEFNSGDYADTKTKSSTKNVGLSPFVGVQVFVLDLPVSIGLEYGMDAMWAFGGNVEKVNSDVKTGGTNTTQEFYQFSDGSGGQYSKLRSKGVSINTNQNVKLVLNLYFGGKSKTAE